MRRPYPWRDSSEQAALRSRARALVVEHLTQALRFLGRERAGVDVQVGSRAHPALQRRTCAQLFEPALEVTELVDVLALVLPPDRPRIRDHVGNGVLVTRQVAP